MHTPLALSPSRSLPRALSLALSPSRSLPRALSLALSSIGFALLAFCLAPSAAHAQNLVTNPGFETGNFTGYSATGQVLVFGQPHSGLYSAGFYGRSNFGTLTQSIPTVAGQTYNISFFLSNDAGTNNEFKALFGTTQGVDVLNAQAFPYQQFSFQAQASGPTTTLGFTAIQSLNGFFLDDISVTAASPVPEASTTVSLGLLLAFGLGGLVVAARRKKITP